MIPLSACFGSPDYEGRLCESDISCPAGFSCIDGRCTQYFDASTPGPADAAPVPRPAESGGRGDASTRTNDAAPTGTDAAPLIQDAAPSNADAAMTAPDAATSDAGTAAPDAMPLAPAATSPPFWLNAAAFSSPRSNLAGALAGDGSIYAMGGYYGPRLDSTVSYEATRDMWSTAPVMAMARERIAAVALGGNVYALGGFGPNDMMPAAVALVEELLPGGTAWVARASMTTARQQLAAVLGIDGRIYAIGGSDTAYNAFATVEAYDSSMDRWTPVASMSLARDTLAAAAIGDRIYAYGGTNGSALSSAEAYTVPTNIWSPIASLPGPRSGHAGVAGPDGRVYAIGGSDGSNNVSTVFAYEPSENRWDNVASLAAPRAGGTAVRGRDGRIYVFGGDDTHAFSSLVEVYGPAVSLAVLSAPAGTAVAVNAGNFGANATVHMYLVSVATTPILTAQTDATGALKNPASFIVPSMPPGLYPFIAVDDRSRFPVTIEFQITP